MMKIDKKVRSLPNTIYLPDGRQITNTGSRVPVKANSVLSLEYMIARIRSRCANIRKNITEERELVYKEFRTEAPVLKDAAYLIDMVDFLLDHMEWNNKNQGK